MKFVKEDNLYKEIIFVMNIKKAKQEIINTVKAYLMKEETGDYKIPAIRQRPILLIGPPGIGKTQIMEQIARECKIGLVAYTITHHTRQSAVGLPFIREEEFLGEKYSVTEYTMSEIIASVYGKIKDSGLKEGILFIDEINCVSETLAPTMLQFLQCKMFGNRKVPDGWLIVAAGNPPEYNKSVREFDMVTLDRVRRIEVEADFDVWKEYARLQRIDAAILSYLQLRPQNFYRVESDVEGMQFVTARGWEDFDSLFKVYQSLGIPVDEEIIYEFLQHRDVARDVAAYIDLYCKYQDDYGVSDILSGNVSSYIYERVMRASFDERLSLVGLIISGLNVYFDDTFSKHFIADKWFEFLKKYKENIECDKENEAHSKEDVTIIIYNKMLKEYEDNIDSEIKSGFYTKAQEKDYNKLIDMLNKYKPSGLDADEAFAQAKQGFDIWRNELEELEDVTGQALEHAFDFMEDAFKEGHEMVVFVTELTMDSHASAYLSENMCERYLKYNEELMIGTKKRQILSMLEKDEVYSEEHMSEF